MEQWLGSNFRQGLATGPDEAASIYNPRLMVAVVAPRAEALKVAEIYKAAMREARWRVEIFDSMNDAEEWIGRSTGK